MARPKSPASPKPPPSSVPFDGDPSKLVVMGRVAGAFGVQGWIKVKAFTASDDALGAFTHWVVETVGGWRELRVEEFKVHSKGPVARLAECTDRTGAERLRGRDIAVPRAALGEAEEGALYQVDLVGLEVVDGEGRSLGRVEEFLDAGAASVMVVKGGIERLIPFVAQYVKAVDREAGRVTVDWKADYDA